MVKLVYQYTSVTGIVTGMIEMKLPKYIRALKGSLYFQRDYPTKLRHLVAKKTYTAPLGLKVSNVTDVGISEAVLSATKAYDLHLRMIENSDPAAFNKDDINSAALEWLRKRNLRAGQFEYYKLDPTIAAQEQREQRHLQFSAYEMAEMAAPEFDDLYYKTINLKKGDTLTTQDAVVGAAFQMIQEAAKAKPQELASLWGHYVKHRGLDLSSRAGKRSNSHWSRWIAITGNQSIASDTLDRIHNGLDAYVEERAAAGVKGASIQRALNEVCACLRYCSKRFRFGWVIEPPAITQSEKKRKAVMSQEQQKLLISKCLLVKGTDAPVAASIILMLQGAMMPSEVGRLNDDDIALDSSVPHLVIRNDTKTKARKRVVPVVLGVDYLKEYLNDAIDWIRRTTDSTPSARIKKLMRELTGDDTLTGHCCRHTFRVNCEASGVSSTVTAAIGGWAGSSLGLSTEMLSYGDEGLAGSAVVQSLYQSSLQIHRHLL